MSSLWESAKKVSWTSSCLAVSYLLGHSVYNSVTVRLLAPTQSSLRGHVVEVDEAKSKWMK
jgi:hypothetical protein